MSFLPDTLGELRGAVEGPPRVHPNGFIQLDLTEEVRLHVWHPRLPYRQRTYHPVHDHVFGLVSNVYSGRLVHVHYGIEPDPLGSHVVWRVQAVEGGEESILLPVDGKRVRLYKVDMDVMQPGEEYTFGAYEFHETLANEPTLTVMEKFGPDLKTGVNSQGASVAVPYGVEPDNDFRRDAVDVDVLWKLIEEAYPS